MQDEQNDQPGTTQGASQGTGVPGDGQPTEPTTEAPPKADAAVDDAAKSPTAGVKPVKHDAGTLNNVADAIEGDVLRKLKTAADRLKPKDRALITRVCLQAAKVGIAARFITTDQQQAKLTRQASATYAALANVKTVGAVISEQTFAAIVDKVIDRLVAFVLRA